MRPEKPQLPARARVCKAGAATAHRIQTGETTRGEPHARPHSPAGRPYSGRYDKYGNRRDGQLPYEATGTDGSNGPYFLLAILVAVGVVGGALFFSHQPPAREQQAEAPASDIMTAPHPALPMAPGGVAVPASPAHPGGTTTPDSGPANPVPVPLGAGQQR